MHRVLGIGLLAGMVAAACAPRERDGGDAQNGGSGGVAGTSTAGSGGRGGAADAGVGGTSAGSSAMGGSGGAMGGSGGMAGGAGGVAGSVGGAETGGAGGEQPILDCAGIEDGTECEALGLTDTICLGDQCVESTCGDGYTDTARNEFCDDGKNGDDTDGCTDQCEATCTKAADCDDGNLCNGKETCNAQGVCEAGSVVSCDDGNTCTTDACIPSSGLCSHQGLDDGASCGSGKICLAESCKTSACGDRYVDTAKGEECDDGKDGDNTDGCTDSCKFTCKTNADCNDGNACSSDTCNTTTHTCSHADTTAACNDGDACTADSCNPSSGCTHAFIDNDADGFSPNVCKAGGSHSGKGGDCNDGDPNAYPGQKAWFTTPMVGGGWDYDCSLTTDMRYPSAYSSSTCNGWTSAVPACGQTGSYYRGAKLISSCACQASACPADQTQACH
ncbi:MAG: hypothetical protein KC766_13845 [Myxococcales bacterium]|nr:hypothetical protein [Myxococcales bacterium]